jgi:hypothetical protein
MKRFGLSKLTKPSVLMLIGSLLIGVAYIAILPPFEGFDEYLYYSGIRQLADTGTFPDVGDSFVDNHILGYQKHGPMPWPSGNPPYGNGPNLTYRSFFANEQAVKDYQIYRRVPADWKFSASTKKNWESQHPPLYFLAFSPIMRATETLPLVTQVFLLRIASYLIAWSGFAIGFFAVARVAGREIPTSVIPGYLWFPVMVPMFFSEFGRIGNDSLCLFLLGLLFFFIVGESLHGFGRTTKNFLTGMLFGLGLLTKAFYLPILAGYTGFMLFGIWQSSGASDVKRQQLRGLAFTFATALIVGGGWYIFEFLANGSPTGSVESISVARHGGLLQNLRQKFSVADFVRASVGIVASWSWAGSWSLVRISPLIHIPLLAASGWLFIGYFLEIRRYSWGELPWLPVWLLAPFVAGLTYHILVVMALGESGTPGWYLHILTPFFGLAFGYGVQNVRRTAPGRIALGLSLAYAMAFLIIVFWSQAALFAGCAIKSDTKYYEFSGHWFCLDHVAEIGRNLATTGWPLFGLINLIAGFACLGAGVIALFFSYINDSPKGKSIESAP